MRRAVPGLDGVLILSTCNRVAIVLDAPDERPVEALRDAVAAFLAECAGAGGPVPLSAWSGHAAHLELFATAAGLTSMVVGEREIAGQLRRALTSATAEGTATGAITRAVEHASAASRRVAVRTSLASTGRSVVSVALDLAASRMPPLDGASVLVVGTGAYAGAAVTALRERGASDIGVYSRSERAGPFAAGHAVRAVEEADLPGRLARADLIITCRGLGGPVLTRELLAPVVRRRRPAPPHVREKAGPLVVLDLALSRDVERAVGSLPGVELIDLPAVQRAVPGVEASQVGAARRIVAQEVASFERAQAGRRMDPVVRRLRSGVEGIVEEEVARMRTRDGAVDAEEAARRAHRQFLRRLDHELKNPLTAMRAAANSLDDDGSRAIIDAQSLRMGRLLKDLRRLAELEVAPLEAEQVDLVETARDAVAAVEQDLAVSGQGRSFALSFPEAPWPLPPVRGDADLLYSAVHNMVSNAAKYTGPDALIEVRGSQTGGFVALEVADTGIGIPAEEIDQVWGELSRASNAQGRPGQGLGTIAARHGGSCSLSSRLGVGTSITMSLPADG